MRLIRRMREGVRSFLADLRAQSVAEVDFKPIDCCRPPDKPVGQKRGGGIGPMRESGDLRVRSPRR